MSIPFWPQYSTQTVIFVIPGYQLFYKESLLNFIIFGMVMDKNRKI